MDRITGFGDDVCEGKFVRINNNEQASENPVDEGSNPSRPVFGLEHWFEII